MCLFHSLEELFLKAHSDYSLKNDYHTNLGQFLELLKKTLKWACFPDIIWYWKQKFWLLGSYEEAYISYNLSSLSYISINKSKIKGLVAG